MAVGENVADDEAVIDDRLLALADAAAAFTAAGRCNRATRGIIVTGRRRRRRRKDDDEPAEKWRGSGG